jgi:hypothetical protein
MTYIVIVSVVIQIWSAFALLASIDPKKSTKSVSNVGSGPKMEGGMRALICEQRIQTQICPRSKLRTV